MILGGTWRESDARTKEQEQARVPKWTYIEFCLRRVVKLPFLSPLYSCDSNYPIHTPIHTKPSLMQIFKHIRVGFVWSCACLTLCYSELSVVRQVRGTGYSVTELNLRNLSPYLTKADPRDVRRLLQLETHGRKPSQMEYFSLDLRAAPVLSTTVYSLKCVA